MQETQVQSLSWEDPLEKGMATHSSILVWRIPRANKDALLLLFHGVTELDMTERLSLSVSLFRGKNNKKHKLMEIKQYITK